MKIHEKSCIYFEKDILIWISKTQIAHGLVTKGTRNGMMTEKRKLVIGVSSECGSRKKKE